jgi:hypothetical protein
MDENGLGKRDSRGRFLPGYAGGPGRPRGSRVARFRRAVGEDREAELIESIINGALAGDGVALRICAERLWPVSNSLIDELRDEINEIRAILDGSTDPVVNWP